MSVKTIFKVLLGTIVAMVMSFMIVELFNISVVSLQIRHAQSTAMRQACELYTQETYKQMDADGESETAKSGTTELPDIYDKYKNVYISGKGIYGTTSTDVATIYAKLYGNGSNFHRCLKTSGDVVIGHTKVSGFSDLLQHYRNLDLLYCRINQGTDLPSVTVTWESNSATLQKNVDAQQANGFYKKYYTPANLGIPYLDPNVVERIYQWNLTKILSENNPDNIRPGRDHYEEDTTSTPEPTGVYYKGFMIYPTQSRVTSLKYTPYNMSGYKYKFNPTNVTPANLVLTSMSQTIPKDSAIHSMTSATGLKTTNTQGSGKGIYVGSDAIKDYTLNNIPIIDNKVITTVDVEYSTVIKYVGITPLRSLFEFVWNHQVDGIGGPSGNTGGAEEFDNNQYVTMRSDERDTATSNVGGTSWGGAGMVPTTGELKFWLVK